ncbi:hypothetical protein [Corynebacterium cystitidis]|uniref:N-succinyldiaminopimelate aminotransferase n=1 Tax=Corynebacterium cystitidis DSM 20524 TaxID=1121357 RepID=A0A1H9WNW9_9CORY|nr:hypothetical protein [Corynebacterium cystitidis]WJY81855.1 Methionine aminotransferase [Corynebacterium cystitidis DSM 20524]SES35600.1 N-succinyldiaminopimelate aminotransferase [Corynebacterium cystitidis DSM 20524]SNV82774.1 aminotransferase [Corynebacterium cystitidis]
MTARADQFDAVHLGQRFPDFDGPAEKQEIAQCEIANANNQCGPGRGMGGLPEAVARQRATGWKTDWALAQADLLEGVIRAKQFMSYVGTTP